MPRLTLPEKISTPEDIVRFFLFLDRVDNTSFHVDDRFYGHGRVQYVDRDGDPAYTPAEAKLRDRLMQQARNVAARKGLDIYEIGLIVTGAPDYPLESAPKWLQAVMPKPPGWKQEWKPEI